MSTNLNPYILYSFLTIFLVVLAYLGWMGYKHTKTGEDYMLAGRKVPPWLMAVSYGSVFISSASIVGFGGMGSKVGLGMFWIVTLNIGIGVLLAYIVFGPRIREIGLRLGAKTMPELLGRRFGSKMVQSFAGIINFVFMPLYAGAVLVGVCRLIELIIGLPFEFALVVYGLIIAFYVAIGGLKGMIYADAVLGVLKFAGMAGLAMIILSKTGWLSAFSKLGSLPIPPDLANEGMRSFTQMPAGGSPLWWLLVTSLLMGVGFGILAQPQLSVRFMTLKSKLDIKRAVGVGVFFILIANGGAIISGAVSNILTSATQGMPTYAFVGNVDSVIPYTVSTYTPDWFAYILLFTLILASISASTAQVHAMATSIGHDVVNTNSKDTGKRKANWELRAVRISAFISLFYILVVAFFLPKDIIAYATAIFFGIAAATFLPSIVGAIFWRRCTRAAVISSMIVGFTTSGFMYLFVHFREASAIGICQFLTGNACIADSLWVKFMDPTLVAVPVSFITLVVVTLLTKRTNEADI
ncbi:MAG TPA: sodium:solute symporter family protein [Caldisericia bacterium]|nr:sodium:solute symporter family protein [Caldisericia bacterium]HPF49505.1 sodium:solute symporter family protein [Caldisericia bacterium]HPI84201.1 sodium:solute symporter family protein [Caldisericia bacterium]HPQ93504.1 sodium:solute symporter family protein [Caldisericia bacterium]HRV75490.1 sodium:solute symporter family protein [Caldisericia bacterium]